MLLGLVTFPLIWVGGLVTTYKAGMAVPDWPSTYGYNMFLYPVSTWIAGPFDLFIEHGHRLLGSLAGLVTIAFVVAVWRSDDRPWLRRLSLGALALVILQGSLGGARVLLDSRTVAMLHGCTGPAFFALTCALILFTSAGWRDRAAKTDDEAFGVRRLGILVAAMAYVQLLLGAQVRHISATASYDVFRLAVIFHVVMAFVLLLHIVLTAWKSRRCASSAVRWNARVLLGLALLQIGLGASTWVMKYGWPAALGEDYAFAANYQIVARGYWQAMVTTGHVAVGSLILALAVVMSLQAFRYLKTTAAAVTAAPLVLEMTS